MSDDTVWPLACRLLARQAPMRASHLGDKDQAAIAWLATQGAVRAAQVDQTELLCPSCGEWSAPQIQDTDGERLVEVKGVRFEVKGVRFDLFSSHPGKDAQPLTDLA